MPNDQGNVYKIAILGDEGSGKTALLVRFLTGRYIVDYDPTIEDTYRKIFLINDEPESVDILDTACSGKDGSPLRKEFLVNGDGFIIVYSTTNHHSFEMVESYEKEIRGSRDDKKSTPYRVNLVGNKSDRTLDRQVTKEEGQNLALKYGWGFCEASAAENIGISEVFFGLAGEHSSPLAEVLASSSDSDNANLSEKRTSKKARRRTGRERKMKCRSFNIFRWHSQP